ncbi:MAG: ATP-binding cassette domain-containing protein, partial [Nanoarchaeota archaeon]|nr:ATP-binding cassette domain-containing protein [Nanoarchaeota archaeon]
IVEHISKKFQIGFKKNQSALERFIILFSGKEPKKTLQALKDVSFEAEKGEIVGIIGENGSGKSTLLRTIAGIYRQDEGKITTNGKMISVINLRVGLQDRLTMKDNIYLCCSLFGLNQKDIKKNFSLIVEFSELENFINTKIYQFSEGMKQKLAFSIAIHCNPDILLLDEVFEVGDESFKIKSAKRIKNLVGEGMTVLLVSHDLHMVERYCDKVIWMEKGRIKKEGRTGGVVGGYRK